MMNDDDGLKCVAMRLLTKAALEFNDLAYAFPFAVELETADGNVVSFAVLTALDVVQLARDMTPPRVDLQVAPDEVCSLPALFRGEWMQ